MSALMKERKDAPRFSDTIFEAVPGMKPFSWDSQPKAKPDPFFAVNSMVITAPSMEVQTDEKITVSITF
jgi:hypothetical protein